MDFIRWIVLSWETPLFKVGLIIPFLVITLFIILIGATLGTVVGFIVLTLALLFWGLVAYVFISREMKEFYKRYEEEKANKPE